MIKRSIKVIGKTLLLCDLWTLMDVIEEMQKKGFKKLTCPPEDWLKTFTSMDWAESFLVL